MAPLEAAYLHARRPSDARIAFFHYEGTDPVRTALPAALHEHIEELEAQILLPTEESELVPVPPTSDDIPSGARIAPALWNVPALALPLDVALRWLATYEPDEHAAPSVRMIARAARLVMAMVERKAFAAPERGGHLRVMPCYDAVSIACLGGLAEMTAGALVTARFATADDPVYSVTPRHLVVSLVGHGLHTLVEDLPIPEGRAPRLPREFWRHKPQPVLEILVPENELEEGVPWALQLLVRPVPGVSLLETMETVQDRQSQTLFPDPVAKEALHELEETFEAIAQKVPPLRRCIHMADGRASLNRQELDQVLDHLPLLQAEGFAITLPGLEQLDQLSARVRLIEQTKGEDDQRPWFQFEWSLSVGDRELSQDEFLKIANSNSPLVFLDGTAVLLSPKDRAAVEEFKKRQKEGGQTLSFFDALRLRLGGAVHMHGLAVETIEASPRLDRLIQCLDEAREVETRPVPEGFIGELRPYQSRGQAWMYYLVDQGFGACLADDMGLGKTIQAITVMLDWRLAHDDLRPILIVCPVSVLGNWRREIHRFAPELRVVLHHGKQRPKTKEEFEAVASECDVMLTSYNLLQRDSEVLTNTRFEGLILDEAQNIKNPQTRQSKAARALNGKFRLALTGTPLENRPLDLWSIMDFLNEGLLGTRSNFVQTLEHPIIKQRSKTSMSALARLVRPFVLRRLKTDPEIISDLPEKTEQVVAASLTKEQATLYEEVVRKGLEEVETASEGMARRGAILTTLLRLKQVCNHPSHYLLDGSALPNRSGKLDLVTEMLTEALEEGDRCLVFTQFKEMGTLLKTHFEAALGEKSLFLHGGVPQKERENMVNTFQEPDGSGPKIFVLSLKAGGTGLNLTMANRVFHYDRWWNPAVEDQATDRAFRIGQQRNVFVHKFVCTGTLEERIQTMLERKREVAENLLGAGENWITELTNEELRKLLVLDTQEALA